MSETQPLVGGEKGPTYASAPPPYTTEAPPPQQAPYPAATSTTTVVTQPPVVVQQQVVFGEVPVQVTCPNGNHLVTTNITYKNGNLTYILAVILCFVLGPCCALIPCCINGTKDVEHTCPVDGTVLGVYKRGL